MTHETNVGPVKEILERDSPRASWEAPFRSPLVVFITIFGAFADHGLLPNLSMEIRFHRTIYSVLATMIR